MLQLGTVVLGDAPPGDDGERRSNLNATAYPLDPANGDQARDWNGEDGQYWASHHEVYELMLGVFDAALMEAADIRPEDRCLDVGCGTGLTTRALADRASRGSVIGLDISQPLLRIARETSERAGVDNVTFVQGDAQVYPFEAASFDVAVSRMGCMFFADPRVAFTNIGQALRPGGRLACTVWQRESDNGWITAIDSVVGEPPTQETISAEGVARYTPSPFSMADPALCRSLLDHAGFVDIAVDALDIPLCFGTVTQAQAYLETWIDEDLSSDARTEVITSLHRLLKDNLTDDGVRLPAATWLISGRRPTS
jgi:ubiquinone/menaquinone biosynthesis C-methylase UbiE